MTHFETAQKTFGKQTKKLIRELCPTAKTFSKVGVNYVIRDSAGACVCTWSKRSLKNGLIVVH